MKTRCRDPRIRVLEEREDGYAYSCINGLLVIQSWETHEGNEWLHTSFSRKSRMPDYHDMKFVKDVFIGKDLRAVMLLPAERDHVNIHPYCLHLFTGDDGLPDFTEGKGVL
jgi:hypothetical protein